MTFPEFTDEQWQGHIDHVTAIARRLAGTTFGELDGPEELASEGLVVLTELALTWDPAIIPSFTVYISLYAKFRLIDWLVAAHGRQGTARLAASYARDSLDDETVGGVWEASLISHAAPSAEHVAVARDTVDAVGSFIRQQCSPRQQAALVASLDGAVSADVADEWSMSVNTLHAHAHQARVKIRAEFDTP